MAGVVFCSCLSCYPALLFMRSWPHRIPPHDLVSIQESAFHGAETLDRAATARRAQAALSGRPDAFGPVSEGAGMRRGPALRRPGAQGHAVAVQAHFRA